MVMYDTACVTVVIGTYQNTRNFKPNADYVVLISAVDKVSMCMFFRACTHFAITDELRVIESV